MKKKIAMIYSHNNYRFSDNILVKSTVYRENTISALESNQKAIHDFLSINANNFKECDGILVSSSLSIETANLMVLYLRLSTEWELCKKPIVILTEMASSNVRFLEMNNFFVPNNHTKIISRDDDWNIENTIENHFINYKTPSITETEIRQFSVVPLKNNHQITNEWAAYKLAYTAKFYDLLPIIEAQQEASKTLYFKYLKLKQKLKIEECPTEGVSVHSNLAHKYLLIDDNYAKGWKLVFAEILKKFDTGLDAFEQIKDVNHSNEGDIINEIKDKIRTNQYQGVLLDLRLNSIDDDESKINTVIADFTGGRILKELKNEFPFLPVIMVTASNKAWNMRQLLDEGADGYFIKEDPESNPNKNVSESSYEAFEHLIIASKNKYKALQPFWKYIIKIENNEDNRNLIVERNGSKVEDRIKERLKMFFGLLKRSFEDTIYNKRFHYSDKTLAFITLWSCLNDIQLIYYERPTHNDWINKGEKMFDIKIVSSVEIELSLSSVNIYLQKRDGTQKKFTVFLKVDYKDQDSNFFRLESVNNHQGYSTSIGEQIAFLLLKFASSSAINNSTLMSNIDVSKYLTVNLKKLKDKRNHIYLTHGDESSIQQLEKNNDDIELEHCAQMFEIVYFLLRGVYIKINI